MQNKPKISIIIPAYNVEKYIERCLKSAIDQTLKEIEIIVINDGSIDNTLNLIENIAKIDSRVKIINKENGGVSSARNMGLEIFQGEYVAFIDGDDWIEPNACELMYDYAKQHSLDIVVSNFYEDYDNGKVNLKIDLPREKIYTNEEYISLLFSGKGYGSLWNKLFRKELYENIRCPEDISIGEDLVVTSRLAIKAKKIGKLNKAFLHYIVNPDSLTNSSASKKRYQMFMVYDTIKDYMIKNNFDHYVEQMEAHKFNAISSFIGEKPYYGDAGYEKSFNMFIKYLKEKPKVPDDINSAKAFLMKLVIMFPNKYFIKFIIYAANFLKRFGK